jgi:hypothetical protein
MYPKPKEDIKLNDWIDQLSFDETVSLLGLWKYNMSSDNISNIIKQLKDHFKKSDIIKLHYDNTINKTDNTINKTDNAKIKNMEPPPKRQFTGNCGRSQCEMRFNGCPHVD